MRGEWSDDGIEYFPTPDEVRRSLRERERVPLVPMDRFDMGWLVAMIEGEGTFSHGGLDVCSTDLDVLSRLANLLGSSFPKIRSQENINLKPKNGPKTLWRTRLGAPATRKLMKQIFKYLGSRRQAQVVKYGLLSLILLTLPSLSLGEPWFGVREAEADYKCVKVYGDSFKYDKALIPQQEAAKDLWQQVLVVVCVAGDNYTVQYGTRLYREFYEGDQLKRELVTGESTTGWRTGTRMYLPRDKEPEWDGLKQHDGLPWWSSDPELEY